MSTTISYGPEAAGQAMSMELESARKWGYDYIFASDHGGRCCSSCCKLRGRVYCISGKDKQYPKLPDYVKKTGRFHPGCSCIFSVCIDFEFTVHHLGDYETCFEASNRPYIDNRTEEQIRYQVEFYEMLASQDIAAENKKEYEYLCEQIPDVMPKSAGAYSRMRNSINKKFLELVDYAADRGIELDCTPATERKAKHVQRYEEQSHVMYCVRCGQSIDEEETLCENCKAPKKSSGLWGRFFKR